MPWRASLARRAEVSFTACSLLIEFIEPLTRPTRRRETLKYVAGGRKADLVSVGPVTAIRLVH